MVSAAMSGVTTTSISGERVFSFPFMFSFAYVASPISRLVPLEMVEALRSALRQRSAVAVVRIEPVINMSEKAVRAVKPWTCS